MTVQHAKEWQTRVQKVLQTVPCNPATREAEFALLLQGDLLEADTDALCRQLDVHINGEVGRWDRLVPPTDARTLLASSATRT